MPKRDELRPANRKAKDAAAAPTTLRRVVQQTERLWRHCHLTYDQAVEVGKHVRTFLGLQRPNKRRTTVDRLFQREAEKLISQAYREGGQRGLLVKTLLLSGARVSEFVAIRAEDLSLDEAVLHIRQGKGRKKRNVPILPELSTHLVGRTAGYLFESRAAARYTPRRVQQIVREIAAHAGIAKRVYPHLLRHTVAQHLLDGGMPLEHVQKFLGHDKLETTQIYAESSPHMIRESYRRALMLGGGSEAR